jgi:phospholipid/cholesterol/gamma-HCH transport system substrate-binding protein
VNETLAATAQALDGLGDRFGQSIANGDEILADLNQRMPQIRDDTQKLADLAGVYADASPDLWEARQPAAAECPRRSGRQARLLADNHPRLVAGAVPGNGHRFQPGAV